MWPDVTCRTKSAARGASTQSTGTFCPGPWSGSVNGWPGSSGARASLPQASFASGEDESRRSASR